MQHFRLIWKKVGLEAPKLRPEPLRCFLSCDPHTDSRQVSESSERPKASSSQVKITSNQQLQLVFRSICIYFFLNLDSQGLDSRISHQTPVLLWVPARWSSSRWLVLLFTWDKDFKLHLKKNLYLMITFMTIMILVVSWLTFSSLTHDSNDQIGSVSSRCLNKFPIWAAKLYFMWFPL